MTPIRVAAPVSAIGSWTIVRLPKSASTKLPSRGMSMAEGTINGSHFNIPLEPDGKGSHWFRLTTAMHKATGAKVDGTVSLSMEPMKEWPEPTIPADLKKALAADAKARAVWVQTTPMAHWDWIRWISSTKEAETRKKRIRVACSKLRSGMRRPCCFNRSMCCEPTVSKNGALLEPQL